MFMNKPMTELLNSNDIIDRVFEHIDNGTTDLGDTVWKEPVDPVSYTHLRAHET